MDFLEFCEGILRVLYIFSLRKGKPCSAPAIELLRNAADPLEVKQQVTNFLKEMKGVLFGSSTSSHDCA